MKCGARMAGALATGYVLGRTKKMKFALMVGSWAAGQKLGSPAELLGKGTELLKKSPEFQRLNDEVQTKLIDAGKAAVTAAAAQRISSFTDTLGSSAERVAGGGPLRVKKPKPEGDAAEAAKPSSLSRFRKRKPAAAEEVPEEEVDEVESGPDDDSGSEDSGSEDSGTESDSDAESPDDSADDDAPAEAPAPRKKTPARAAARSATSTGRTATRTATRTGRAAAKSNSGGTRTKRRGGSN